MGPALLKQKMREERHDTGRLVFPCSLLWGEKHCKRLVGRCCPAMACWTLKACSVLDHLCCRRLHGDGICYDKVLLRCAAR